MFRRSRKNSASMCVFQRILVKNSMLSRQKRDISDILTTEWYVVVRTEESGAQGKAEKNWNVDNSRYVG